MMKRFISLLLSLALSVFVFGQNQMFLRSTQAPPSGAGILDAYPGAAFAAAPDVLIYSSHSVTDNTAGSQTNGQTGQFTVLVQRDSDNALRSFTYTEVSDGTLSAWVGPANNGTVQILYDQSGNNNHATQGTAANQPKIVDAGSLVVENGKAAMLFSGNQWLKSVFASSISPVSGFLIVNHISGDFAFDDNDEVNNNSLVATSNTQLRLWSGQTTVQACFSDIPAGLIDNQVLSSFVSNGSSSKLRTNAQYEGVPVESFSTVKTMSGCTLGAAGTNIAALNGGNIAFCVLYGSDKTSEIAAIETIVNTTYNNIY